MTSSQDWLEASARYRAKVTQLESLANAALDAGNRNAAYLLFGSAQEYIDAAIDADEKGMMG
jgi:hypothetical protein